MPLAHPKLYVYVLLMELSSFQSKVSYTSVKRCLNVTKAGDVKWKTRKIVYPISNP